MASPARLDRTPSERVIDPTTRVGAIAAWRDVMGAFDVVRAFAARAIRLRYRQAVLGVLWAIIQPLALLVPFTLFLRGSTREVDGVPYAASTLAALVGWQFLSAAVGNGSSALVSEAVLVRKSWFPREAPVLAAVLAAYVDLAVGTAMALAVGPLLGAELGIGLVGVPIAAISLGIVAIAIALPLAALNALFRDVRHALAFVLLLWLFASPVTYPVERVDAGWRVAYAALNPAVGPLDALRRTLAHGELPDWGLLAVSIASALVIGALGHRLFRRLAPTLPDVI